MDHAVPRGWRTSRHSSDGATYLRDTEQHGHGPVVHLDGPAWSAFLDEVARGAPSANGAVEVTAGPEGGRTVREQSSGAELHFRADEWAAFRAGVLDGESSPGGPDSRAG